MEVAGKHGWFITIEGPEGAGKTTIAGLLRDELVKLTGGEVVLTADPGGERVADRIRKILLDGANSITPKAELFLFLASRAQVVSTVILPAIERGAWVINDRFNDSTLAYQGFARGLDIAWLRALTEFAVSGLVPDLTILLDLPVEVGLARQQITDRIGGEALLFHQRVRDGYLALAREEPKRIIVVDAAKSIAEALDRALHACRSLGVDGL